MLNVSSTTRTSTVPANETHLPVSRDIVDTERGAGSTRICSFLRWSPIAKCDSSSPRTVTYFLVWTMTPEPKPPFKGCALICRSSATCGPPPWMVCTICPRPISDVCWTVSRMDDFSNFIRRSSRFFRSEDGLRSLSIGRERRYLPCIRGSFARPRSLRARSMSQRRAAVDAVYSRPAYPEPSALSQDNATPGGAAERSWPGARAPAKTFLGCVGLVRGRCLAVRVGAGVHRATASPFGRWCFILVRRLREPSGFLLK